MGEQVWSRAREREGIRFSHEMYVQHCSPQRKNTEEEEEEEEVEKKKTTGTSRGFIHPLASQWRYSATATSFSFISG